MNTFSKLNSNISAMRVDEINKQNDRRVLLRGAMIITMDSKIGDLECGDILIEGKKIAAVGPDLSGEAKKPNTIVLDATDQIITPGFQDVHRHCWYGQLSRVIPDVSSVGEYLTLFYDRFAVNFTAEDTYIGTLSSALACIDCGVTNVHDFLSNNRSAAHSDAGIRALSEAGIRATHVQCGVMQKGVGEQWPEDLARIKSEYFSSDHQLLSLRLGLVGSSNFSPDKLSICAAQFAFARDLGIGITADGVIANESSERIVQLGKKGLLGKDVLFTHCLDLSDEAWDYMADSGVGVALTPTSDTRFGISEAIPPIQKVLDLGIESVGIGIDTAINLRSDLFSQMEATLVIQRMNLYNRRFREGKLDARGMDVKDIMGWVTINGARAVGLDSKVGSLTPGKEADLNVIDTSGINVFPVNNAYGAVVSACDSRDIHMVMIGGVTRKWGGELLGVDIESIRRQAEASRNGLYERSQFLLNPFDKPELKLEGRDYHGHGKAAEG